MSNPLISIIVPVYNVEKYLSRCLESLVSITYKQKEIILIDDCSSDSSLKICQSFSSNNSNITLLCHKQNQGVQEARITGLKHSKGDYVMFVDSDDYVHESILDELLMAAKKYDSEMVACGALRKSGDNVTEDKRNCNACYNRKDLVSWLTKDLFFNFDIQDHSMFPYTWGKLWKKKNLLDSLYKGRGLSYGEDMITVLDYIDKNVNCLVLIDKPLYVHVLHEGQVTAKSKIELIPSYLDYWEKLDSLNIQFISNQISGLIFRDIKPSIYEMRMKEGLYGKKYINAYKKIRNNKMAIKYLFENPNIPDYIKKHPHNILLKYRLYWLDYIMYLILWMIPKK